MKKSLVIVSKTLNRNTIKYYSDIFSNESIYFVSPKKDDYLDNFKNVIYKKDSFFLKRDNYPLIEKTFRPNWYYQQFLKYAIVLKLDYDLIHIVDGDSYVKRDIVFEETIYYTSKKIENNYSNFISKVNNEENNYSDKNYITNQMCFNKSKLSDLLNKFTSNHKSWVDFFCDLLIKEPDCWLSEYQLYADYVLANMLSEEKLIKVFRRFDFISDSLKNGFIEYSVLAEEPQHKSGILRKIRAIIYYRFKINLG